MCSVFWIIVSSVVGYSNDEQETSIASIADSKEFNPLLHGRRSWVRKKVKVDLVAARVDMMRALKQQQEEEDSCTLGTKRQYQRIFPADDLENYNISVDFIHRISVYNSNIPKINK